MSRIKDIGESTAGMEGMKNAYMYIIMHIRKQAVGGTIILQCKFLCFLL